MAQVAINQQTPPSADRPFLEEDLTLSEQSRSWINAATLSIPIVGTGSPEGVVEAPQRQSYIDEVASTGSVFYIKQANDDGLGDKTKGWQLIG